MIQLFFVTLVLLLTPTIGTYAPIQPNAPVASQHTDGPRAEPFSRVLSELPVSLGKQGGAHRALASADFDGDGIADLALATAIDGEGELRLFPGNPAAIYGPDAARQPAFFPGTKTVAVPHAPSSLVVGDFDADGLSDAIVGGATTLDFFRGDGAGGFAPARTIELHAEITAVTSGDVNRADGLPDVAVAVRDAGRARVLVFESPTGAIEAIPESFPLRAAATGLVIARLDDDAFGNLAVTTGTRLVVIGGRDRRLSAGKDEAARAPAAVIRSFDTGVDLLAVAAGDFGDETGNELAVLADDGSIRVCTFAKGAFASTVAGAFPGASSLMRTRASAGRDNVAVVSRSGRSIDLVRQEVTGKLDAFSSVRIDADVVDAIPMRLNADALDDFVIAGDGAASLTIARTTGVDITVTTTDDSGPGSLREAILIADGTVGVVETIGFAIPGTGPHTILLADLLPLVIDPVVIDGSTQLGPTGLPSIVIDGAGSAGSRRIDIRCGSSTVRGLNLQNALTAVQLESAGGNIVEGNVIGLDATGTMPRRCGFGVRATSSPNNVIGGRTAAARNVISGNGTGIFVDGPGSPGSRIEGNYIGTDFAGATAVENSLGINVSSAASTTIGAPAPGARNIISGNRDNNVHLQHSLATACLIQGNYIGVDVTGTVGLGDGDVSTNAIDVFDVPGLTIGGTSAAAGNVISGTARNIDVTLGSSPGSSSDMIIQGNFVGTNANGSAAIAGSGVGISTTGPHPLIGGTSPGAGNVISGNTGGGCGASGPADPGLGPIVLGNRIGTDASGSFAIPNGSSELFGDGGLFVGSGAVVGGTEPGAPNIISGNVGYGLVLQLQSTGSVVKGNFIGVGASGASRIPNADTGLLIQGSDNIVGGFDGASSNVIAGNGGTGISIVGDNANHHDAARNAIVGNFIGTNASGIPGLGNAGAGVQVVYASALTFGGTAAGAGNVVLGNGGPGIEFIEGSTEGSLIGSAFVGNVVASNAGPGIAVFAGTRNSILDNSIRGNAGLGIDLGPVGVNGADPGDADEGANSLQNAPTLSTAVNDATSTVLSGRMNTTPNTTVRIQVFANGACDPAGFGEGETLLGELSVTTNAAGEADVVYAIPQLLAPGSAVTATATAPNGDTSEFSNCTIVISLADLEVTGSALPTSTTTGSEATFTFTVRNLGPSGAHAVSLLAAVPSGSTFVSASSSAGTCTTPEVGGVGDVTCSLGTLGVGSTATVSMVVTVTAPAPSTVTASATVSGTEGDPDGSNNAANASVTVVAGIVPPSIGAVVGLKQPFRVKITGTNFQPGALVFIGDDVQAWPSIKRKFDTTLILKKGRNLSGRFPRGIGTTIRVVNPDGGVATAVFVR